MKKDVFNEHFMGNNEISNDKIKLFQTEIMCLQNARMQDFISYKVCFWRTSGPK